MLVKLTPVVVIASLNIFYTNISLPDIHSTVRSTRVCSPRFVAAISVFRTRCPPGPNVSSDVCSAKNPTNVSTLRTFSSTHGWHSSATESVIVEVLVRLRSQRCWLQQRHRPLLRHHHLATAVHQQPFCRRRLQMPHPPPLLDCPLATATRIWISLFRIVWCRTWWTSRRTEQKDCR